MALPQVVISSNVAVEFSEGKANLDA